MYNCSKCGYSTDGKSDFQNHLESCYGNCSPFWFYSQLRAAIVALIVTWSLIAIIVTAHAAPQSPFSVQVYGAGHPLVGETVTATKERLSVVVVTDVTGYASFGDLPAGDWLVTACGQSTTFTSSDDADVAAIWFVDCNRIALPLIAR